MATSDDHRFKPIYSLIVVVLKPLLKDCRGNVVVFPFRYRIIQDDDGSSIKDFQWIHHSYQLLYPTFTWLAHSIPSSWVEETAAHTVTLHNENSCKQAITYWLISILANSHHCSFMSFLRRSYSSWAIVASSFPFLPAGLSFFGVSSSDSESPSVMASLFFPFPCFAAATVLS